MDFSYSTFSFLPFLVIGTLANFLIKLYASVDLIFKHEFPPAVLSTVTFKSRNSITMCHMELTDKCKSSEGR